MREFLNTLWMIVQSAANVIFDISIAVIPVVFVMILIAPSGALEFIISLIFATILVSYYSLPIHAHLERIHASNDLVVTVTGQVDQALANLREFGLGVIPEFKGFSVFGHQVMVVSVNHDYVTTLLPLLALMASIVIRSVVNKWVRNRRLKRLTREYWLFLTAYIVIALILHDVTSISFWFTMLLLMMIIVIIATNVLQIFKDALFGFVNLGGIAVKSGRIFLMYLAYLAAEIAKVLRRISSFVARIYRRYIVGPFRAIYTFIWDRLDSLEGSIDRKLKTQDFEDDQ